MYRQLAQLPDLPASSLRLAVSAGEALSVSTRDRFGAASGVSLLDALGSTEMLHVFVASRSQRAGAIGQALPGYRVAVLDDAGQPCAPGVPGRLAVQGPTGCRYWRDAENQAQYVQQGWNLSGDAALQDADGYIHYLGRCDDMLICDGFNIAPLEIEQCLQAHPALAEIAVCLLQDEVRGQVLSALLVMQPGQVWSASLQAELQALLTGLARYKQPQHWLPLTQLPRNQNGKLQRRLLPALAAAALFERDGL